MTQCKTVYRPTAEESMTCAVVKALAAAKDVDPIDLDVCLYDHVDTDALDKLFDAEGGAPLSRHGRVSFTMSDWRVVIEGAQKVIVTPLLGDRPPADEAAP